MANEIKSESAVKATEREMKAERAKVRASRENEQTAQEYNKKEVE